MTTTWWMVLAIGVIAGTIGLIFGKKETRLSTCSSSEEHFFSLFLACVLAIHSDDHAVAAILFLCLCGEYRPRQSCISQSEIQRALHLFACCKAQLRQGGCCCL